MNDKTKQALEVALEALEECRRDPRLKYEHPYYDKTITAIREALAEQPAQQQEPVAKPYAYEYGRDNFDGTYSVVIEKGDLVQTAPAVYNYVRPRNAHKDWPIKELFDHPPAQRTWVGLTEEDYVLISQLCEKKLEAAEYAEHLLREKNHG